MLTFLKVYIFWLYSASILLPFLVICIRIWNVTLPIHSFPLYKETKKCYLDVFYNFEFLTDTLEMITDADKRCSSIIRRFLYIESSGTNHIILTEEESIDCKVVTVGLQEDISMEEFIWLMYPNSAFFAINLNSSLNTNDYEKLLKGTIINAIIFWKKLGVQAIVILVLNAGETELQIKETLRFLKELNVIIKIFHSNKLSSTSLSQIIRVFGAGLLPDSRQILANETILIVSDADLVVFNISNHLPNLTNGKKLHIYNIGCCSQIKVPPMRGDFDVKMYSMSTIAATVQSWKEIMSLDNTFMNSEEIENYIIAEFGKDFFHSSDNYSKIHGTSIWYADQSLISYKIYEWSKIEANSDAFSYEYFPSSRRIDRFVWPTAEQFAKMKIEDYYDSHQPEAPFSKGEWEKYKPFLEFYFKGDKKLIDRILEYRENFIADYQEINKK